MFFFFIKFENPLEIKQWEITERDFFLVQGGRGHWNMNYIGTQSVKYADFV